ncbi:endospore germination permease [Clostridium aestuarii]|uniref:Endospore germination permease n=1 Tax=Clostridium aestuarii TaxID=338193 RepID=A0ABT4D1B1_9CLOT|nr:endospore germination permease [Clostridium aestuarii]MCY6484100.1 endospore germination permease [Clostridium aestuarii]
MNKEVISDKQGISLIVLFIIGESSILVMGLEAEKDLWLAIILAIFMALPIMAVYSKIHYLFPHKDFFDIIEFCFGRFISKAIIVLFTWYMIDLTSLILRDFGNFIKTVSLPETPIIIIMMSLIILCIWAVKEGTEVMGRWAEFFLPIVIIVMFSIVLLLIPNMNINNIRPVLYNGINPVVKGAFGPLSIPFVETVSFTMAFSKFKTQKSPYKVYIIGLLLGGIILLMTSLTNTLVLGINSSLTLHYPSYSTVKKINIGEVLQRLEALVALVFMLGGFIKISITLLAACKGFTRIFGYNHYQFIVTPIALFILNLSYFEFDSVMDYMEWNKGIYPYYAFPFQVIFPIVIWGIAEIKKKRLANQFK